jgi:hypothetical protein
LAGKGGGAVRKAVVCVLGGIALACLAQPAAAHIDGTAGLTGSPYVTYLDYCYDTGDGDCQDDEDWYRRAVAHFSYAGRVPRRKVDSRHRRVIVLGTVTFHWDLQDTTTTQNWKRTAHARRSGRWSLRVEVVSESYWRADQVPAWPEIEEVSVQFLHSHLRRGR